MKLFKKYLVFFSNSAIFFLAFLIILINNTCREEKNEDCFFCEKTDTIKTWFRIKNDTVINRTKYYEVSFNSYTQEGFLMFNGYIFKTSNSIFYKDKLWPYFSFKLLDFNLKISEYDSIYWNFPQISYNGDTFFLRKEYKLLLRNKFWDQNLWDTIYNFSLEKFGLILKNDNPVIFVGKKTGIIGSYVEVMPDSSGILKYKGNLPPNFFKISILNPQGLIYKELLDSSKFIFGRQIL